MLGFLFSAKGRITRKQYWLSILAYFGVMVLPLLLLIAGRTYQSDAEHARQARVSMHDAGTLPMQRETGIGSLVTFVMCGFLRDPS